MLKSKLKYTILLPLFIAVFCFSFMVYLGFQLTIEVDSLAIGVEIATLIPMFFIFLWAFWGELRTKALKIAIDSKNIAVSSFGGLGREKTYALDAFDGYNTSELYSASGSYQYIYLMFNRNKAVKISSFYISNYIEIFSSIKNQMPFKGETKFNTKDELIEVFK